MNVMSEFVLDSVEGDWESNIHLQTAVLSRYPASSIRRSGSSSTSSGVLKCTKQGPPAAGICSNAGWQPIASAICHRKSAA